MSEEDGLWVNSTTSPDFDPYLVWKMLKPWLILSQPHMLITVIPPSLAFLIKLWKDTHIFSIQMLESLFIPNSLHMYSNSHTGSTFHRESNPNFLLTKCYVASPHLICEPLQPYTPARTLRSTKPGLPVVHKTRLTSQFGTSRPLWPCVLLPTHLM